MNNRVRKAASAVIASMLLATPAFAWDGVESGKIVGIEATHAENFAFRIHLAGVNNMCGTQQGWAYINQSDSNYEVITSLLMSAWLSDKPVSLYTTNVNGYCLIGHISVS